MTQVILLAVENDVEAYEMDGDKWLKLATSDHREGLMTTHGKIASDGIRMHIDRQQELCECDEHATHEKFEGLMETVRKDMSFAVAVDRELLLEALAGIDDRYIALFIGDKRKPIVIQGITRQAILMPVDPDTVETELTVLDFPGVEFVGDKPTPDAPSAPLFA
jgi:hypothetical protein